MEQVTQGLFATPGGPEDLCAGAVGWVMVDQDLTGDHGGSRELGWAPGSFKSLVAPGDTLRGSGGACVPPAVLQTGPQFTSIYVLVERRETLLPHPPDHVQESSGLRASAVQGGWREGTAL